MGNPLCYLHDQLEQWRREGTYQRLRILESESAAESRFDGKDVINLASNNYLGLTTHPKLREAAIEATRKYGVGSGAVRTISGTMSLHMELEERIAAFKRVEACVVFQSGFAANAGTVAAILAPEDHIVSDELNHASIIDGCRLSKAGIHVFPHKDVAAADKILAELESVPGRKLLITDGVFSMDGDIAPLPGLVEAAARRGAIMMIDDAHSSGVLGRNGRGTVDHFDLHGRVDLDRPLARAGGSRRPARRHHDDRRRALLRRARPQRARHGGSFRPARPRGYPGGHAIESHRRPRRIRVREPRPDRVPVPPRAAVPVLYLAPAGRGGILPGRVRCAGTGARAHPKPVGQHEVL